VGGKKHPLMFMDESESLKRERLKMLCNNKNYLMINLHIIRNYSSECQFQYRITKRAAHFSEVYLLNKAQFVVSDPNSFNPLMPELNPSEQSCLLGF